MGSTDFAELNLSYNNLDGTTDFVFHSIGKMILWIDQTFQKSQILTHKSQFFALKSVFSVVLRRFERLTTVFTAFWLVFSIYLLGIFGIWALGILKFCDF